MEIFVRDNLELELECIVAQTLSAMERNVNECACLASLNGILRLQRLVLYTLLKVGTVLGYYHLESTIETLGFTRSRNLYGNGGIIGKNIAECHLRIVPVRPKVGLYPRCTTTHIEIQTVLALVVHQLLFATGEREKSHGKHQY